MAKTPLTHIAFIADGNRTWARQRGLPSLLGHEYGAKAFERMVDECLLRSIPYMTFWALSTENMKRSEREKDTLFLLLERYARTRLPKLLKNHIQLRVIGNYKVLPKAVVRVLDDAIAATKFNEAMVLTLAINYGGQEELLRATKALIERGVAPEDVNADLYREELRTAALPNPDLIVRTGGFKRTSGFMPWHACYSEYYFTDCLWPDFDALELDRALKYFVGVVRKLGK